MGLSRRVVGALIAFAITCTACNSTTRLHTAANGVASSEVGGVAAGGPDATDTVTEDDATVATDAIPGAPGTTARPSTTATRNGKPATLSSVKIGVVVMDYGAIGAAVGAEAVAQVATYAMAKAVIDTVNAEGGLAGHKIEPVYFTSDLTKGEYAAQAQAACTNLTEDNHVFAVVGSTLQTDVFASCLKQHKTVLIASPWVAMGVGFFMDEQQMAGFAPYYHLPNMLDPRLHTVAVDRWVANGFLKPTNRIGIIHTDAPAFTRVVDGSIKPRLAHYGLKVTDEVAIRLNNSFADISGPAAEEVNTVLRFRSKNIDRILMVAPTGGGAFFFMPAAESQGYRPKYGVTSFEQPYFLQANEGAAQLSGAEGIGWEPSIDTDPAHDPGPTPGRQRCTAIMKKAGQSFGDRGGDTAMFGFCESFFFLQAALAGATTLSAEALQAGADRLGTSFPSVLTFGETFRPGRRASVSAVRDLHYADSCSCFVYSGPLIPVG